MRLPLPTAVLLTILPCALAQGPTTWRHTTRPSLPEATGGLVNPDFSNGLTGWTVDVQSPGQRPGSVQAVAGQAVLREGTSFLVSLIQEFTVPSSPDSFCFDFEAIPGFDRAANGIPDAFEVQLLDASFASVVPTWDPQATSFFNVQEDGTVLRGSTTVWDGRRATVDVRHLRPGSRVTLFVDLIGADSDEQSQVRVDNFCLVTCPGNQPPVLLTGPLNNRVKTHFGATAHFTLTFGPPEQDQEIARIEVQAAGLANFTFDPPVLGPTGSVTCHFQPDRTQITTGSTPHSVRITAYDDCSTPLSLPVDIAIEVCTCPSGGTVTPFGEPWPGTLGDPELTCSQPSACSTILFQHTNSHGVAGTGCLWLGLTGLYEPTPYGGRLYVDHFSGDFHAYAYALPVTGATIPIQVPCFRPQLCGMVVYAQAVQLDPGASNGISSSRGLALVVGN